MSNIRVWGTWGGGRLSVQTVTLPLNTSNYLWQIIYSDMVPATLQHVSLKLYFLSEAFLDILTPPHHPLQKNTTIWNRTDHRFGYDLPLN